MPYKSAKQRRYLHAKKPAVAEKFDAHGGRPIKRKRKAKR